LFLTRSDVSRSHQNPGTRPGAELKYTRSVKARGKSRIDVQAFPRRQGRSPGPTDVRGAVEVSSGVRDEEKCTSAGALLCSDGRRAADTTQRPLRV
jgi:hypothetical protein